MSAASGAVPAAARLPRGSVPEVQVDVPAGAVVVTDLHLAPGGDARTDAFMAWWRGLAPRPPALIVLGDLFDTWVGPKQARMAGSSRVLGFLSELVLAGTAVHLVPGNRDALMGDDVVRATGASLHLEGFIGVQESGQRLAFVHGDSLCTLDRGYQRLRWVWRFGPVRGLSRIVPLFAARAAARRLRRQSERAKPLKLAETKSIQPAAVEALALATGADVVVCGHAHEPRDLELSAALRWIVVGAFGEGRGDEILRIDAATLALDSLEEPA